MLKAPELDLSILIPAYNEEEVIAETVLEILSYFRSLDFTFEVLIVDNNSSDNTLKILKNLESQHQEVRAIQSAPRPGYGVAVKSGLEVYEGASVVIVMADGSETPEDIANLYELIRQGSDCGFGTRFRDADRTTGYPPFKLRLNRMGNFLVSKVAGFEYDDFTNGFKAYKRWVIDSMLPLAGEEFELTIEMALKAVMAKASIGVAPNSWRERDAGGSKFKVLRQCGRYLRVMGPVLLNGDGPAASLIRFLAVGATSSLAYLLVLSALVELVGFSTTLSSILAYVVGTIISYFGSAKFAFKGRLGGVTLARFLTVVGASFFVNATLAFSMERAGAHYLLVGLVIIVCVSAFNYVCHRTWTFRETSPT